MINPMDLTKKLILVTGASSGIGRETAIHLSKLGAKIILVARSEEKLKEVYSLLEGEGHKWYSFDLKQIEKIEVFIKKIIKENGKVGGFVHSAGISAMRPLKMTKYSFLHDMMLINFYSFIEMIRFITKKGNYNENLSIVCISSLASIKGYKGQIAYSATKAAVDGAIRSMSKELAEKKIRINSIISGMIKTDMYLDFIEKTGKTFDDPRFSIYSLGLGEAKDIANAVSFLLSDSSIIITGSSMKVDSGATT